MKRKKEYSISYNYDAVGNRTQKLVDASSSLKELKSGSYDYFYDNDNRLVEEVYQKASSGWGNSWGSCFSWQGKGNKHGAGHGKVHEEVTSYLYDLNGNMLEQKQGRDISKFSYDASDNMIMADVPGKKPVDFTFNGDGQRIARFFRGKGHSWGHGKKNKSFWKIDTSFLYNGPEVLAEFDSKGKLENSYTAGPGIDNLISVTQHKGRGRAKSYFYAADPLGSIRQVLDSRGKSVNSYSYSPYGVAYNVNERVKQPYRYTGRRWDSNVGKLWYRSRHYAPGNGSFSQADKWTNSVMNPVMNHSYVYTRNNPISWSDPFGNDIGFLIDLVVSTGVSVAAGPVVGTIYSAAGLAKDMLNASNSFNNVMCLKESASQMIGDLSIENRYNVINNKTMNFYNSQATNTLKNGMGGTNLFREWSNDRNAVVSGLKGMSFSEIINENSQILQNTVKHMASIGHTNPIIGAVYWLLDGIPSLNKVSSIEQLNSSLSNNIYSSYYNAGTGEKKVTAETKIFVTRYSGFYQSLMKDAMKPLLNDLKKLSIHAITPK